MISPILNLKKSPNLIQNIIWCEASFYKLKKLIGKEGGRKIEDMMISKVKSKQGEHDLEKCHDKYLTSKQDVF